ncbi:probable tRNA (uracil-O(2)-)-methyltransferase isoform X1 [Brienomyrus brachyistius]|uniref:probable tRNA (uracil-O(2)-)-methyltransferase isoform X1 n=1 Tax=Brienomyrus brachyistius TaxID=42636 RepID=UPI0020B33A4A|nr:probable tRNA (uracil-O(2)-)-methyltransferase isoform X1 [Brienomyrus brachyistius]XP_048826269.1 probable tRNA (uracil-O(2)-)-methyltransferase isoform X1 [Brienomyrus brachyistius]
MLKLRELPVTDTDCVLPVRFWSAVDVWIKKPHVLNKRLCGVKEEDYKEVNGTELEHILSVLWGVSFEQLKDIIFYLNNDDECHSQPLDTENGQWCYEVRTIIPKVNSYGTQMHKEIILKDLPRKRVMFLPFEESADGDCLFRKTNVYQIQLNNVNNDEWSISVSILGENDWFSDGVVYPRLSWLGDDLLPRLVRWAMDSQTSEFKSTLSLLPIEKYGPLYQELKAKYREIVKVWPEVTDPEKFVYEDVAIATYLLVLWEEERAERGLTSNQSFVDLGCGNGLLVHILCNEGHPGRGLDVRRRKIWDMYGPQTQLEESAIIPSDGFLFPEADWLIGNHSDELTPWIPVISSRSSYSCRFFVIPCCFFDFSGKYQRRRCRVSQYREYIDFVSEVGSVCGFQVEEDCLRIPSTKRVCLIGRTRSYEQHKEAQIEARRSCFISSRAGVSANDAPAVDQPEPGEYGEGLGWGRGFQPRQRTEAIRNCASLPRDLVERVVSQVALALLSLTSVEGSGGDTWNGGGSLTLREVAELLDKDKLLTLKKECGGLQTLLKNNHQVFTVESGRVSVRDWRVPTGARRSKPGPGSRRTATEARKTRPCWFHAHHPQGCPLEPENCAYAHGEMDLHPASIPQWRKRDM